MDSLRNVKSLLNKFRVILSKPQKMWAAVLFVMTLVGAVFEAIGVSAVLPLINVIIDPGALRNNEIGAKLLAPFPGITDEEIMFFDGCGCYCGLYFQESLYVRSCLYQNQIFLQSTERTFNQNYQFLCKTGLLFLFEHDCGGCAAGNWREYIRGICDIEPVFWHFGGNVDDCLYLWVSDY